MLKPMLLNSNLETELNLVEKLFQKKKSEDEMSFLNHIGGTLYWHSLSIKGGKQEIIKKEE